MFRIREVSLSGAFLATIALGLPPQATAQRSGVEIWSANCGRCHVIQPALRYSEKAWDDIGMHMTIYARLTSAEEKAVVEFLKSGAQRGASVEEGGRTARIASLSVQAATDYAKQCAACHGSKGDGRGPAATAFNPGPTDFTDPNSLKDLSDDDLVNSIMSGKNAMPAFGAILSSDEIRALAAYVRDFSARNRSSLP